MSKKKGIIRLVVLLAVIAFVVYTAVSGLGSDRSGSLNDISLGLDLRGGVSITYEAVGDVNSQDMSDTKAKLEKRVQDYSTEAPVSYTHLNKIRGFTLLFLWKVAETGAQADCGIKRKLHLR